MATRNPVGKLTSSGSLMLFCIFSCIQYIYQHSWWFKAWLVSGEISFIPLIRGFHTPSLVLVWDFWTINSPFAPRKVFQPSITTDDFPWRSHVASRLTRLTAISGRAWGNDQRRNRHQDVGTSERSMEDVLYTGLDYGDWAKMATSTWILEHTWCSWKEAWGKYENVNHQWCI